MEAANAGGRQRQPHKHSGHSPPRKYERQQRTQVPRNRGIENESWFARAVVGERRPARKPDALMPLPRGIHPGRQVKEEVAALWNAPNQKWPNDCERDRARSKQDGGMVTTSTSERHWQTIVSGTLPQTPQL